MARFTPVVLALALLAAAGTARADALPTLDATMQAYYNRGSDRARVDAKCTIDMDTSGAATWDCEFTGPGVFDHSSEKYSGQATSATDKSQTFTLGRNKDQSIASEWSGLLACVFFAFVCCGVQCCGVLCCGVKCCGVM